MNIRTRKYESTSIKMTDLQFETWPATGLTPNRYCFLYALFGQCREKAKDADDLNPALGKLIERVH